MSTFTKQSKVPETIVGEEGSAKRNIIRKGAPGKTRKDGLPGQAIDDGSLNAADYALDQNDPNYDSEDESKIKVNIPKLSSLHRANVAKSSITLSSYKKQVETIITEYFVSGDIDEVVKSIMDVDAPEYSYELVKRLINMSCDKTDKERELVSQLLSELYPDILSRYMIGKGFERLFEIVDEIEKDCPSARLIISTFLARAVVDEVLPPAFLNDAVVCNLGGDVVDRAKMLLSREHAGAMLEHSWGPGDGRPVSEMKVIVDEVMQEYLLSKDVEEAKRCLTELNTPHFYHEILKRGIINAIDKSVEDQKQMSLLFDELSNNELLSTMQAEKGFKRLFDMLPDLILDTPDAQKVLTGFLIRAKSSGVVSKNFEYTTSTN